MLDFAEYMHNHQGTKSFYSIHNQEAKTTVKFAVRRMREILSFEKNHPSGAAASRRIEMQVLPPVPLKHLLAKTNGLFTRNPYTR